MGSILRVQLLDGVVGQVHRKVVKLWCGVFVGGHPDVALLEQMALMVLSDQHPQSRIKFTIIN